MLRCICQTHKPAITSASHVNWDCDVWYMPNGILNGHYWGLPVLCSSLFTAWHHSIASVPRKEVCSLWISLVQWPSINTQSQKARGIWSSKETHPDAPCSSGQTQIKKPTRAFYRCPLTRPESHLLVRRLWPKSPLCLQSCVILAHAGI